MHYYEFNIGDYCSHTRGLSLMEDLAYRRLIDQYYLSEKPFKVDLEADQPGCNQVKSNIARSIGMQGYEEEIGYILINFFYENDGYLHNKRIDEDIKKYQDHKKRLSDAGKRSAESKKNSNKNNGLKKPNQPGFNQASTRLQPGFNQVEQPLTINHKPLTINHKPPGGASSMHHVKVNKKKFKFEKSDIEMAMKIYDDCLTVSPHSKKPNFENWANELRMMRTIDNIPSKKIYQVFSWANQNPFWQTNILSPKKLRKQFAQLEPKMQQEIKKNEPGNTKNVYSKSQRAEQAAANVFDNQPSKGTTIEGDFNYIDELGIDQRSKSSSL